MENALTEEIVALWRAEIGLGEPYRRTVDNWLTCAPVDQIQCAIVKTGRKVRQAAGTDRPFSAGSAVVFCSNVINSGASQRSATVQTVANV